MNYQKVTGAPVSLKRVTRYSYNPYCVQKAVFYSLPLAIRLLWNTIDILSLLSYFALINNVGVSLISDNKYQSFLVILFRPRLLIQNYNPLLGFLTKKIGAAVGDLLTQIQLLSNNSISVFCNTNTLSQLILQR